MSLKIAKIKIKWREESERTGKPIICALCLCEIHKGGTKRKGHLTADHIITVYAGGKDNVDNLQPAHERCNRIRSEHTMEWVEENRHVFTTYKVGIQKKKSLRKKYRAIGIHEEKLTGKALERFINQKTQLKINELEALPM